ncbi:uncharacterized protein [Dendrobates tinctorius]|uniref:uncharacterized protein n=1 Tax=Dendrobates tinctorius TaxID=92724 RepID=UPI003CC95CC6
MYVLMIFIIFTCSMSSESEYSPSRQELAQADRETSSSSSADGNSEGEQQEQRSQFPVVIRNVPQRDEDVYLDNEQLISLVQERSPLWDSRDRLYKDNVVTRRLWNEVAAALMDGWDSATASAKKAFSEYFPALYCAAVTVVLDGTVGFRARRILAGNPTVSSWSTVTALSIVLLHCAAVTVVLDGTVGFRARRILAGNPKVSSWSTVTALSIVLLHCAAVTVVLDGTVGFRARRILAGNPTVSSWSTVTALSIVLLHCAAVTVVLDGTVGFRARRILAGNPTVSSWSTVTALSVATMKGINKASLKYAELLNIMVHFVSLTCFLKEHNLTIRVHVDKKSIMAS